MDWHDRQVDPTVRNTLKISIQSMLLRVNQYTINMFRNPSCVDFGKNLLYNKFLTNWNGLFNNDTAYWMSPPQSTYHLPKHIHCVSEWANGTLYLRSVMLKLTYPKNHLVQLPREKFLWRNYRRSYGADSISLSQLCLLGKAVERVASLLLQQGF